MEDSSLDDFFAKKDKSKKAKKKFTTTDQIARKLEESGKKGIGIGGTTHHQPESVAVKQTEKEKMQAVNAPITTANVVSQVVEKEGDDEWRDFEEEKEKDYSGLKIQNLQITESKDDEFERERNEERDEDGDLIKMRDSSSGPWNKSAGAAAAPVEEKPPTPPPVVEVEPKDEEKKPAVYRPPHQRSGASSATSSSAKGRHSNKTAPEISSDFHFPSLSAAADNTKPSKKGDRTPESERGFESVKRGSRTSEDVSSRGPKLDLGNKYNALSHSDLS